MAQQLTEAQVGIEIDLEDCHTFEDKREKVAARLGIDPQHITGVSEVDNDDSDHKLDWT